jgi:hypothetical protein
LILTPYPPTAQLIVSPSRLEVDVNPISELQAKSIMIGRYGIASIPRLSVPLQSALQVDIHPDSMLTADAQIMGGLAVSSVCSSRVAADCFRRVPATSFAKFQMKAKIVQPFRIAMNRGALIAIQSIDRGEMDTAAKLEQSAEKSIRTSWHLGR